jgi:4-amino-4-deoxy-L-arabinose transferase-like glycosyltransferase
MPGARHPYRQPGTERGDRGLRLSEDRANATTARDRLAPGLALGAILVVAALLRGWRLDEGGVLVPYYFAGVRSMLQGWHNLFFNAFDPAGFVSLDKPPVAFWLQTLSAWLLGFGQVAVLLPQVVEGVAAVALLYWLVRRRFGAAAGLLAALFLALTPLSVAVDRSNNTESCLVLVLLLAAWALCRAVETGKVLPLLLSAALVGIGFNVKMLVAFGVVPAFALVYLLGAPCPLWRRCGRLVAAGIVLAPVALSWSLVYELTPPEDRPFVDSTQDNSMLELVVGHNFVQRFVRRAGTRETAAAANVATDQAATPLPGRDYVPAGPLRLAAPPLAAQLLWLFPLALIGAVAAWWRSAEIARLHVALWAAWALAYGIVFSAAGGLFHSYYLVVMAPALCALAAIGAVTLWRLYRDERRTALPLPAAILATGLWQAYIVRFFLAGSVEIGGNWLVPALLGTTVAATLALVALRRRGAGLAVPVAACALAAGLALPVAWSVGTGLTAFRAGFPAAHPPFETRAALGGRRRWAQLAGAIDGDPKLIAFLEQSRGDAPYLLAAINARQAAPIIIATGAPVMALGGFTGRDPILSVDDFARLVAANQVRFALIGDGSPALRRVFGEDGQKALTDWVRGNGREVDPALWRGLAAPEDPAPADGRAAHPPENVGIQLYDLRPASNGG